MNHTSKTAMPTDDIPLLLGPLPDDVQVKFVRKKHTFSETVLDADALKVVRRLLRFGYETYLVEGCVRDLLLGAHPKDFDVVTSARPAEVKSLFRNCRLIGRRFRLAHLHFKDQKIIEVATFRREPLESDDLTSRHAAQNLFGNAADDAVRRDFTVNALMYDVANGEILDWVGGLDDISDRMIRAIGAPSRRLPEDPVRIIRAAKFATKLGLGISEELTHGMQQYAPLIAECSKARLIEELFKILRSGYAAPCLSMLSDIGALFPVLPGLEAARKDMSIENWAYVALADEMVQKQRSVSDSFLLASLLYPVLETHIWDSNDVSKALGTALKPVVHPLQFTKKHLATVRQAFVVQRRMARGPKNKRLRRIAERDYAMEAIDILEISGRASKGVIEQWRKLVLNRNAPQKSPLRSKPRRRRPPIKKTRTPKAPVES